MVLDYYDSFSEVSKIKSIKIVDNELKSASITFGVPTYKRVNTLRSTLDSIISQNGNYAFNIIVSDNNPERDDETERMILSSFANTKGLVYYKHATAMSPAWNFNKLLELCKTDYLIMVHDDDELLPSFLIEMMTAIHHFPTASIIKCNKVLWDGKNKPYPQNKNIGFFDISLESLLFEFKIAPTGCVMRIADFLEVGGFSKETLPATDYALVAQLLLKGKQVLYYNKQLMYYRCCDNDTSNPATQEKLLEMDKKIKQEIEMHTNIPSWYVKLSIFICTKMHRVVIKKINTKRKSLKDYPFFMLSHIYSRLSTLYFRKKILM